MDQLKKILENINLKNFDKALNQCNEYELDSNKNIRIGNETNHYDFSNMSSNYATLPKEIEKMITLDHLTDI